MSATISRLSDVQSALIAWHDANGLQAPWRASGDPYECLVAAVMAQQTQMSRVLPSYERFVAAFPTLASLAEASAGDVIRVWDGMGYNTRAVRLHRAARAIHAQGWPRDAASLARIDGIGPFTAAIIASFAFGERAACVDTNVRRVLGRLAGDPSIDGKPLQALADASAYAVAPAKWNQALMDYGARVCTTRPKCSECVVAAWCASRDLFTDGTKVAEPRAKYRARAARKREPKYEGSARWYRGRIVALLRALPKGERVAVDRLPALIVNGYDALPPASVLELLGGLERDGLASVVDGAVSLPD
jgi:A/G-specific adenine glycosylase